VASTPAVRSAPSTSSTLRNTEAHRRG
jgi:hypothetical protein